MDQCQVLAKQVEHQKKLYSKQHERNQLILKTNQTLSDMMEQRQQRCHELELQVSSLTQSMEKRRTVEESSKFNISLSCFAFGLLWQPILRKLPNDGVLPLIIRQGLQVPHQPSF
mmetsp:Transcript_1682/g.2601  ORF Transcript_1682/g.2601 Transcript_1682/m.2601 type:complete len:115 (-) Transcript_1682:496-840(-)